MKAILSIAYNEIVSAYRDTRLKWLGGLVLAFMLIASYTGYIVYEVQRMDRLSAQRQNCTEWVTQGEKHPHLAAHFGTFVFKPKSLWSFLDFGVDNYTGTYVYLEAHKQNDTVFKPAQEHESIVRFGALSGAVVLQLFIPLLIVFLCYGSIAIDKEQGILTLLMVQGISMPQIIYGKILGCFSMISLFLLVNFIMALSIPLWFTNLPSIRQLLVEGAILWIAYTFYFFILVSFSVWVSAFASSSKSALLILLALWISLAIIVPKAMANIGDEMYPLPTETSFKSAISSDVERGLDGHNSSDVRAKALEKQYLAKYKVDSLHQLPLNFEGILLLESEAYTSRVYDKHFDELQQIYDRQDRISSYTSLLNPYLAIRHLSMAISQTDFLNHLHFKKQAEQYRRYFVQEMNRDMAMNSKMDEFEVYKANQDLWRNIRPFRYTPLTLAGTLLYYRLEVLSLFIWAVLLPVIILFTSSKIKIV